MKLMTMKQYMNMSKPALIRKITKTLRAMPKVKLARLCYNITKAKLPRLRTIRKPSKTNRYIGLKKRKYMKERHSTLARRQQSTFYPLKKKRKFSRKQLAAQRLFAKRARAGTLRKRRRR